MSAPELDAFKLGFTASCMKFPVQLSGPCGGVAHHASHRVGFHGEAPARGGNGEGAAVAVLVGNAWEVAFGMHHRWQIRGE